MHFIHEELMKSGYPTSMRGSLALKCAQQVQLYIPWLTDSQTSLSVYAVCALHRDVLKRRSPREPRARIGAYHGHSRMDA